MFFVPFFFLFACSSTSFSLANLPPLKAFHRHFSSRTHTHAHCVVYVSFSMPLTRWRRKGCANNSIKLCEVYTRIIKYLYTFIYTYIYLYYYIYYVHYIIIILLSTAFVDEGAMSKSERPINFKRCGHCSRKNLKTDVTLWIILTLMNTQYDVDKFWQYYIKHVCIHITIIHHSCIHLQYNEAQ